MMAHTPGPWTSDWDDNGFFTINPTRGYVMGNEGDQSADDALLMAAAPELLTLLKEWRGLHRGCVQDTDKDADFEARCQLCVYSDTAIAKATGGA